tara:strand:+ start:719 stop:907 length:189 start_codon:yes stop_codon:yes gene_type:complete
MIEVKKTKPARYIHILPIPMDDEDFDAEGFIRGGFYNWIFEQAELKNIMFDYVEQIQESDNA